VPNIGRRITIVLADGLSRVPANVTRGNMQTRPYVLLYDRDCGICSALGEWIRIADFRRRIEIRSIQSSLALLPGIPETRALDAFHMVAPEGVVTTGGDAVPTLIEAFPVAAGLGRILRRSNVLMGVVQAFYRFLTRFRDRLVCRVDFGVASEGSVR